MNFDYWSSAMGPRATILTLCFLIAACQPLDTVRESPDPDFLAGAWEVDLRPTPGAEPYYQELVVTSVEGDAFSGTFYGTDIAQARINSDWGTLRIAFVTSDGSGPYYHSAVLIDKKLEGLSNSTGRDFLAYWSAVKR